MARRKTKRSATASKLKKTSKRKMVKKKKKVKRKSKVLRKKFATYRTGVLKPKFSKSGGRTSLQPENKRNRSENPTGTYQSMSSMVLRDAKTQMKTTPVKQDKAKKSKTTKIISKAKKIGKGIEHAVEQTGKIMDKAGALANKLAPGLTEMAILNPEMPFLSVAAGAVDTVAGLHTSYHGMVNHTYKGYIAGHPNNSGIALLTDSSKYQKLQIEQDQSEANKPDVQTLFELEQAKDPLPLFPTTAIDYDPDL